MAVQGVYLSLGLLLTSAILIQYSVSEECTLHKPNDEIKTKGLLKNISVLSGQTFSVVPTNFKYRYAISICSDISKDFPFASAIKSKEDDPKSIFVIGRLNDTHIAGSNELVLLSYASGDNYTGEGHCQNVSWKTSLLITCSNGPNELVFMDEDTTEQCSTVLHLKTPLMCPPVLPPGLGKGSVFCILLLTGAIMYFAIGIAYRRVMTGAKGLEQIPHYQFWRELGNLQADGCDLVCRKGSGREDSWNRITSNFNDSADEPLLHP